MGYPKNFPSGAQIQVCVVAGGDITDPASDHSCNQRLFSPLEHKDGSVDIKHLSFSPLMHSPTGHSQQSFHGAHDPGSLVYVLKTTGQNGGVILGQANDLVNPDNRSAGNFNLMGLSTVQELINRTIQILIPPNIEEKEEKGAKVKKIKEKGKEHSHGLLKGLPSNGALYSMSGFRLPELKNVPTAVQQFSGLMTNDMLNNMPGDIMSLGGMFSGLMGGSMGGLGNIAGAAGGLAGGDLGGVVGAVSSMAGGMTGGGSGGGGGGGAPSLGSGAISGGSVGQGNFGVSYNYMPDVLANVSPRMADAITSMSTLVQGAEGGGSIGSYPVGRVHTETYLANAADLLSQVQTIDDLMTVMHQLQFDESLFGLDKLQPLKVQWNDAWGAGQQVVDPVTGSVSLAYANNKSQTAQSNFSQNMSSSSGAPSSGSGGNMFGSSAGTMMDMFKRLAPNAEKQAKQVTETLSQGMTPQKLMKIARATIDGGNPLDMLKQG